VFSTTNTIIIFKNKKGKAHFHAPEAVNRDATSDASQGRKSRRFGCLVVAVSFPVFGGSVKHNPLGYVVCLVVDTVMEKKEKKEEIKGVYKRGKVWGCVTENVYRTIYFGQNIMLPPPPPSPSFLTDAYACIADVVPMLSWSLTPSQSALNGRNITPVVTPPCPSSTFAVAPPLSNSTNPPNSFSKESDR
jgi:hypothetical protein